MMFTNKISYQIASPQAVMWAPGVIWNQNNTQAYLYYFHFFGSYSPIIDQSGCRLLTSSSPDLSTWLPYAGKDLPEQNLIFRDIVDRDFCVFWDARLGKYLMYYCADALKVRTSNDLLHWSDPVKVLRDSTGSPHGYSESPLVIYRNGYYYLWTSGIDYSHTHLFISEDPFNFGDAVTNSIEEQPGHAPEIVSDHGTDYMACSMVSTVPSVTPAAHDLDGILIQPLRWDAPDPGMAARVTRKR
jgi:beta-xylosidase